jgi:cyclase
MIDKNSARLRRSRQTRLKIREIGAVRLTVHRTNVHIYAQITSPGGDKVLASASSVEKELRAKMKTGATKKAAEVVGSQSIVVVMDVKKVKSHESYGIFVYNGREDTGLNPVEFAKMAEQLGAGELVINSIDRDGLMIGYDLELARKVRDATNLPITILGGAGSLNDIAVLIEMFGTIGAAAGSLFVFKGRFRAVLINYPSRSEKDALAPR